MNNKYKLWGWTVADVMKFQEDHELPVDGFVGYKTMNVLIETGTIHIGSEVYLLWKQDNPTYYYNGRQLWYEL